MSMIYKRCFPILAIMFLLSDVAYSNDFYVHGNFPTPSSPATSASMRAELDLISAGFSKLPTLSGNAGKVVIVNGGATGLTTTVGGLLLGGTLTVTGAFDTTLVQVASTMLTFPAVSGTLATLDGVETFLNKSLITPVITAPTGLIRNDVGLGNVDNTSDATKNAAVAVLSNKTVSGGVVDADPTAALGIVSKQYADRPLPKTIYGLTYANNAGDATNDLDIAAGGAMDVTGVHFMVGPARTKQSDVTWAVGTAAGCLDTGVVGNSDYYLWIILRSDTGVIDYLCSLSATSPTMPTNYDFKRLFGWFKRVGGTIVAFHTYEVEGGGLEYAWDAPTRDINLLATLTTARRTDAVKVPLNFSVMAHLNVAFDDASAANFIYLSNPDLADLVPDDINPPLATQRVTVAGAVSLSKHDIRTSATGTIAARCSVATADAYRVATLGFTWARRN